VVRKLRKQQRMFIGLEHPKIIHFLTLIKGIKGKIHIRTGHEAPEGA